MVLGGSLRGTALVRGATMILAGKACGVPQDMCRKTQRTGGAPQVDPLAIRSSDFCSRTVACGG